jgi:hypothetical protein
MATFKWSKGVFSPALRSGEKRMVSAHVLNGVIAVHRTLQERKAGWSVSHVGSGYSMGSLTFARLADAKRMAEALWQLEPTAWDNPKPQVAHLTPRVRELTREFAYCA